MVLGGSRTPPKHESKCPESEYHSSELISQAWEMQGAQGQLLEGRLGTTYDLM